MWVNLIVPKVGASLSSIGLGTGLGEGVGLGLGLGLGLGIPLSSSISQYLSVKIFFSSADSCPWLTLISPLLLYSRIGS